MVTFRRVSPWYPGHDGAHRNVLPGKEEDGDGGAGGEPEGEEDEGEAGHYLSAPLLRQVAVVLLSQVLLLLADVSPEIVNVQLDILDVVHVICSIFAVLTTYGAYQDSSTYQYSPATSHDSS